MSSEKRTYKSHCHITLMICFYCISEFYIGYTFTYLNSIDYQKLHDIFQISFSPGISEGLLTGCLSFGGVIGALSIGYILNHFSRRQAFIVLNIISIVAGAIVLIQNLYTLFIGRIIQGLCIGALSGLVPIMIKQLVPTQISGTMGIFQYTFMCLGYLSSFLLSYILQQFYQQQNFWRVTFAFTLITVSIQQFLFVFYFKNQTPKYLLLNNRIEEAQQLINKIYLPQYRQQILKQKMADIQSNKSQDQDSQNSIPVDSCFALFVAISLVLFQQLSGGNIILNYGIKLSKQFIPGWQRQFPIFLNLQRMFVSLISSLFIITKVGRKTLVVLGSLLIGVFLLIFYFGLKNKDLQDTAINLFMTLGAIIFCDVILIISLGSIPFIYAAQIVQPNNVAYVMACHWGFKGLLLLIFPIIVEECYSEDCPQIFLGLSASMFFSFIFCWKFMIETKGKNQKQIRQEFAQSSYCNYS